MAQTGRQGGDDGVTSEGVDPDRAAGALLGLAVGDALGTTLEFKPRDMGRSFAA